MAFAILRTSKLKSFGEIGSSLSHNYRTRKTPNADATRTHKNEHEIRSAYSAMEAIKGRMPDKVRKNAVLCVEYLITASPEWSEWGKEGEKEFFDKSLEFLKAKHGAENVITTSIHRDEKTPHLVAYVVPIDGNGKLNARHFLGGRDKLSQMQTAFAEDVKNLGLERGLAGSKAEHTTIKSYYAEIQKPVPAVKNSKILKIEKLGYHQQPKFHFLDAKILHGERVMNAVYENIEQQINAFNKDVTVSFSDMHINFEKKLAAGKLRADKFEKAHEKAVLETRKLREEYETISEYKRLFPVEFENLEQRLNDEVAEHHQQIEAEKYRKKNQEEVRRKQQAEDAKRKEQDFIDSISENRKKHLEAQYSDFLRKIDECTSEPQKLALTQIYDERSTVLSASPTKVMNEILKTDGSNYYSKLCLSLFQIKTASDFQDALDETVKFFEITAPFYEKGQGVFDSVVTRKVCAASLNQLNNLLVKYGSAYSEQSEVLQKHLLDCEKVSEQNSFKHVFEEKIADENHKNYLAEKPVFLQQHQVVKEKSLRVDFEP